MPQFLGFGDGSDGDLVISANTTDSVPVSTCAGASGNKTLTVKAAAGFTTGMIVGIYQVRGAVAGQWELGQVDTYAGTTLTLLNNKDYTYTNTGGDAAQVKQLKQYRSITVQSGFAWKPTAWDATTHEGGILSHLVARNINVVGSINGDGLGFAGGLDGEWVLNQWGGGFAEGTGGVRGARRAVSGNVCTAANGSGGGGGGGESGGGTASGGGGGGHANAGSAGSAPVSSTHTPGGASVGVADGTSLCFGGAGGGGGSAPGTGASTKGGAGGASGTIIQFFFGGKLYGTGTITNAGSAGANAANIPTDESGGGGGGSGGSNFFQGLEIDATSFTITAPKGAGGAGCKSSENGGAGSDGRNIFKACTITSDSIQTANKTAGGLSFCVASSQII